MPRIRTIKPEFWTSETVAELSLETRLTFIGIWNHCDDRGVWKLNPRLISSALYPLDDPSEAYARTERALGELSSSGRITCFEADGKRYFQVANWVEHQRIDKPTKSTLPLPSDDGSVVLTSPFLVLVEPATTPPRELPESSTPEVVSSKGRERKGNGVPPPAGAGDASSNGGGELVPWPSKDAIEENEPDTAGGLIGYWSDLYGQQPTPAIRTQIAKQIREVHGKATADEIREAARRMVAGAKTPSFFQQILNEVRNPPRPELDPRSRKPSTTDQRVAAGLALRDQYALLDAAEGSR